MSRGKLTKADRRFCKINQREPTAKNRDELDSNANRISGIPNVNKHLVAAMTKSGIFERLKK